MVSRALRLLSSAVLVAGVAQTAPAGAVAPPQAREVASSRGIFIAGWDGQDFATRIANTVAARPDLAETANVVVAQLTASAAVGIDVNLVGSPGDSSKDIASLSEARAALRPKAVASRVPDAGVVGAAAAGPTDFELRGFAKNSSRSWEVRTALEGAFCSSECEVTDTIRQTWTITPQRNADQFSFTSTYVRNSGNFSNIYADGFVLCNGSECAREEIGSGGSRDGTGSGTEFIEHRNQAGSQTINRVRLRALFRPNSTTYWDGVRTGTANCRTGSAMFCVF